MLTTVSFTQLVIAAIWKIYLMSLMSINIHFYNGIKINSNLQACQHLYFAFFFVFFAAISSKIAVFILKSITSKEAFSKRRNCLSVCFLFFLYTSVR